MEEERLVKKKQRAKRNGNTQLLAEVSKDLGDLYSQTGRLDDALTEYLDQLEACRILANRLGCARAHRMVGEVYANLGDYDNAFLHQKQYLEIAKEVNNKVEEQRAYATLGRTNFLLAESLPESRRSRDKRYEALADAEKAFTKSLHLCKQLQDKDVEGGRNELMLMRARLFLNMGSVQGSQADASRSLQLFEQAKEICMAYNLNEDLHRVNLAVASLYEKQGDRELSLLHVDAAGKVDNSVMRADALLAKAELFLKFGDWTEARKVLVTLFSDKNLPKTIQLQTEKLLRIAVTLTDTEEELQEESQVKKKQKLYETLGDAAVACQSYKKAVDYYQGMLQCAEQNDCDGLSAALVSLSRTLRDAGRCKEAVPVARRELELCSDPREACKSALFLCDLLEETYESYSSIREMYNVALSKAREAKDVPLESSVWQELRDFSESHAEFADSEEAKKQLDLLAAACPESDSEQEESETPEIGINISLEDLPELQKAEDDARRKDEESRVARRKRRGVVVKKNEKGETQLHVACIQNNIRRVEQLLEAGHPVNVEDYGGWTPLHEAANHGHLEIAELLLNAGANVNHCEGKECNGITPLLDAASAGNCSMIRLLLRRGASPSRKTTEGETVLDCLEAWRGRVGDLSPNEQSEYDELHRELLAKVPKNSKPRNKTTTPRRILDDLIDEEEAPIERISAGEDYKRTIASFRSRPVKVPGKFQPTNKITAPLLDSDQILEDDWLEDDIGVTNKKNGMLTHDLPSFTKRKSNGSSPVVEKACKRQRINSLEEKEQINICDEESCDSNASEVIEVNSSFVRRAKRARQSSLLSAGFSRDSSSCTPSPVLSHTAQNTPTQFSRTEIQDLQVYVEEKMFQLKLRVPEQAKMTVAEIAEDVGKKFQRETGCMPRLSLMIVGGDVIAPETTLDAILTNEKLLTLTSEVVKMEIPPISERYTKICNIFSTHVQEGMLKCLKTCENTSTFRLKARDTAEEELWPLLRCLEYQNPLQVLQLSGGAFFQFGEALNRCLARLNSLQEVHLRGCDIDSECLAQIKKLPAQLRVLDLSYNPLGKDSESQLYDLLSPLRCLQTLNLRYCNLQAPQNGMTNNTLTNLDVSWNPLGGNGVRPLLQAQMLTLNLSHTVSPGGSPIVPELLNHTLFSLHTVECLELACCDLNDSELMDILAQTPNLTRLVVRGNSRLSVRSMIAVLERKPTLCYVDISGCEEIVEVPSLELRIENPESCTLVASMAPGVEESWIDLWRGRGTVQRLPHHVVVIGNNF